MAAADLQRAFQRAGYKIQDSEHISRCVELGTSLGLTSADVASAYMTWAVQKEMSVDVSAAHVSRFLTFLQAEHGKENRRGPGATGNKPGARGVGALKTEYMSTPKRQATDANRVSAPVTPSTAGIAASPPTPQTRPGGRGASATPQPMQTPPTGTKFAARTNRGAVVSSLNPGLQRIPAAAGAPPRAPSSLRLLHQPLDAGHLYMMETVDTKIFALDERLLDFAAALKLALPGDEADGVDLNSVAAVAQEPVWVVGRIVADGEGGGLNEASVLLEGCRQASGGQRVLLDLRALDGFRIFPGQAVCVKGVNPTGTTFVAQQLCTQLPAPRHAPAGAAAAAASPGPGLVSLSGALRPTDALKAAAAPPTSALAAPRDVSLVVAAGPYTLSDDLAYEPLQELLRHCTERQPDVVMLLGPFVDVEHPAVKGGLMERSFEDVFRSEVLARVGAWQRQQAAAGVPPCRVAVMPSARDATAAPVYPQPALSPAALGGSDKVTSLPNPATFSCDGLVVSAATHDIIKHLVACEVSRGGPAPADKMAALAGHVVGQRSFYPLYPPALGSLLDTSGYSQLQLPVTPDLLLLPSEVAPFAKLLLPPPAPSAAPAAHAAPSAAASPSGSVPPASPLPAATAGGTPGAPASGTPAAAAVLAVNPGRLARGTIGGTFAHVTVLAAGGSLAQRCKVDIVRI